VFALSSFDLQSLLTKHLLASAQRSVGWFVGLALVAV